MPTPTWARIVIVASAGSALVLVWVTTGAFDFPFAKAVVTVSSAVILALMAFDRWLWRRRPLRWLHDRPVLHGTWKIELRSSHPARAGKAIEAYLVIRQTYSAVRVDGLFEISDSECLS